MLRLILNASEDAIFLVDTNGVFLTANEALAHRFGVTPAEVIGMKGFTEKPEDVAKQRRAHFARAIATKLLVHFDDEHAGRRLENVYHPTVDARGNVTKVAVFSHDITERTRVEEELEIAARFPSENPSPILRLSGDGALLYANAVGSKMLERYLDNVGKSALTLLRPASVDALKAKVVSQIELGFDDHTIEFWVAPIVEHQYVNFLRYRYHCTQTRRGVSYGPRPHHRDTQSFAIAGNRATSVQSFAENVTTLTLELMHLDVGALSLVDDDARYANLHYACGVPETTVDAIKTIPLDDTLCAASSVEGSPPFIEDQEAWCVLYGCNRTGVGRQSTTVPPRCVYRRASRGELDTPYFFPSRERAAYHHRQRGGDGHCKASGR